VILIRPGSRNGSHPYQNLQPSLSTQQQASCWTRWNRSVTFFERWFWQRRTWHLGLHLCMLSGKLGWLPWWWHPFERMAWSQKGILGNTFCSCSPSYPYRKQLGRQGCIGKWSSRNRTSQQVLHSCQHPCSWHSLQCSGDKRRRYLTNALRTNRFRKLAQGRLTARKRTFSLSSYCPWSHL